MKEWRHSMTGVGYWAVINDDDYEPRDPVTDADVERFFHRTGTVLEWMILAAIVFFPAALMVIPFYALPYFLFSQHVSDIWHLPFLLIPLAWWPARKLIDRARRIRRHRVWAACGSLFAFYLMALVFFHVLGQ